MNKPLKYVLPGLALFGLGLTSCQPELDEQPSSKGQADFTKYVAVGNSLTAGYGDNGLSREGQLNSYPNLLAQKFRTAGGGEFVQPLFSEAQANGSGYLRLKSLNLATSAFVLETVTNNLAVRSTNPTLYTKYTDPVQNLGVPGIRVADVQTPGYGSTAGNAYYERLLPDASALKTYLTFVQERASDATFFTCWLGNNDVLGYATAGGASGTLTSTSTFTTNYTAVINALTANGAKGVVATLPNVTAIPFFTTVGPVLKPVLAAASVPGLVIMTGSATGGPASGNRKQIATVDIRDAAGNGRQLFTLTASTYIGATTLGRPGGRYWRDLARSNGQPVAALLQAFGIDTTQAFGVTAGNPIPSSLVLDDVEQGLVNTATTAFNATISSVGTSKGLAVADMNAFFTGIAANGVETGGIRNTTSFISGNLFSLDGVHPTPRGYAIVANEFIRVINAKYGSDLTPYNATLYRGVVLP